MRSGGGVAETLRACATIIAASPWHPAPDLAGVTNPDLGFAVRIEPQGWQFQAPCGQSLREAAAQAGVVLPSSCRNGTCRECLCRLLDGCVSYAIEWPGLSTDERREGCILPCVARAETDLVIHAPRARRA